MTTTTTVKAEVVNAEDINPSVLVYTDDPNVAVAAARRELGDWGIGDGDTLITDGPRLWRWIPVGRHSGYYGEYSKMLQPWDKPGRGAFTAIEVRIGEPL